MSAEKHLLACLHKSFPTSSLPAALLIISFLTLQKLGESFPKFSEKLTKDKGMDLFSKRATELSTALHSYYYTFVDVLRFNDKAIDVLVRGARELTGLDLTTAPELTASYLNLLTVFIKLQLILSRSFETAKCHIPSYARAHHLVSGNSETHYALIAQYVADFAKPLEFLRNDARLAPVGTFVGRTLMSFSLLVAQLSDRVSYVRHGTFNVVDKPEDVVSQRGEATHKNILFLSHIREWILWSYMLFPAELAVDGAVDVLAVALADAFFLPVHRDEQFDVHAELETLFDDFQIKATKFKLSKHKKILKDAINDYEKTQTAHVELRRFLCSELQSVTALFRLAPQVVGPKLMLALALLRISRDEVMWYIRHIGCKPYRASSKLVIGHDPYGLELLHRVMLLSDLISENKRHVETFHREALAETARQYVAMKDVFVKACSLSPALGKLLESIAYGLAGALTSPSFEALRLNIMRMSTALAYTQSGIPAAAGGPLATLLNQAVVHSRAADSLSKLVETHASFKNLHWFSTTVQAEFEAALPASPSSVHTFSLVRTYAHATQNVHRVCPEELQLIGDTSAIAADQALRKVVAVAVSWVSELASDQNALRGSLNPSAAGYRLEHTGIPMPGVESQPGGRTAHLKLSRQVKALGELAGAVLQSLSLVIFQYEFSPRQYLITGLQHAIRMVLRKLCVQTTGAVGIQRPSLVLHSLHAVYAAVTVLDQRCALGLGEIMRTVLQTEFAGVHPRAGGENIGATQGLKAMLNPDSVAAAQLSGLNPSSSPPGVPSSSTSGSSTSTSSSVPAASTAEAERAGGLRDPILNTICKWYTWLISQELDTMGIMLNQQTQCFESRPYLNEKGHVTKPAFDAQLYTDRNELLALAKLLGPHGIGVLQRHILAEVQKMVERVFALTSANIQLLGQVKGRFTESQLWLNSADQVQFKDEFLAASIIIGCALRFRRMLQAALREVTMQTAPLVAAAIDEAIAIERANAAANPSAHPEPSPISSPSSASSSPTASGSSSGPGTRLGYLIRMAEACGAPFEQADASLRDSLRRFKTSPQDAHVWELLPEMYSICLSSSTWMESRYDIAADAHDSNVHTLCDTIRDLIVVFKHIPLPQQTSMSSTQQTPTNIAQAVRAELERFVECASHSLLNIGSRPISHNNEKPQGVPRHMMVFLEQFVSACPGSLRMSKLEDCFPYTMLRTNYIQMYEQQSKLYSVVQENDRD